MVGMGVEMTDPGERAARERLRVLFDAIDRLSPDELARIGYVLPRGGERDPFLDAVDEAARQTGRAALVGEARDAAREAVLARYSAGSLHPTFVGLNWGLSQGTVETRVAIAETLADAAAAAVVEDVLDPDIAAALALDAAAITDLATGQAYDGSLGRLLQQSDDPTLRPARGMRGAGLVTVGVVVAATVLSLLGLVGVVAAGVIAAGRTMTDRVRRG